MHKHFWMVFSAVLVFSHFLWAINSVSPETHLISMKPPRATKAEIPGIWGNPVPVAPAPKMGDSASTSDDPLFLQVLNQIQDPEFQKKMNAHLKKMHSPLSFPEILEKWHTDNPKMSVTQLALNIAVIEFYGPSVLGNLNPKICSVLTPYAQGMANADSFNAHEGIEGRWNVTGHYEEIVQPTFHMYRKDDASVLQAARDCMHTPARRYLNSRGIWTTSYPTGWDTSPAHWSSVQGTFKSFCYDMRKSVQGGYYCVGAFSKSD